jgi:hypothetical protein
MYFLLRPPHEYSEETSAQTKSDWSSIPGRSRDFSVIHTVQTVSATHLVDALCLESEGRGFDSR